MVVAHPPSRPRPQGGHPLSTYRNRPAFAPWDVRETPNLLSPEEQARRARAFAEVERRMSALLDSWADRVPEAHARRSLERHAKHHSWHAQLWEEIVAETGVTASGAPLSPEVEAFVAAVEQGDDAVDVLAGVFRVLLPRKVAAYTFHLRALGSGASDAAVRSLGFIMQDERDTFRDGELLLQSLITTPDVIERAAARRIALENLILRAGGLAGPGTLGGDVPQEVTSR